MAYVTHRWYLEMKIARVLPGRHISCESNESKCVVSTIICPVNGGHIREVGENRGTNSDSDLRPKGSNLEEVNGDTENKDRGTRIR